ncbi:hypothetical protein ACFS4T_11670 [Pseudomonas lini]
MVPFVVEVAEVQPGEDHQIVQHGAVQPSGGRRPCRSSSAQRLNAPLRCARPPPVHSAAVGGEAGPWA